MEAQLLDGLTYRQTETARSFAVSSSRLKMRFIM